MLYCLQKSEDDAGNTSAELSVLERQRALLQSQQQRPTYFHLNAPSNPHLDACLPLLADNSAQLSAAIQQHAANNELLSLGKDWPEFGKFPQPDQSQFGFGRVGEGGVGLDHALSRTTSCPPAVAAGSGNFGLEVGGAVVDERMRNFDSTEKLASSAGKESFKKRKAEKPNMTKVFVLSPVSLLGYRVCMPANYRNEDVVFGCGQVSVAEDNRDKRIKVDMNERDSNAAGTEQNNNAIKKSNGETSAETSKENSKVSDAPKMDYIHVRARRGQATDSHSLAERVRREKISERMKYLQDLVPGCNKITGKAGMLDEIINYVQSLQRQVEFLSMKLAAVNPRLDFNVDNFFTKEVFPGCTGSLPTGGMLPEMENPAYLQFAQHPMIPCCGLDMAIHPPPDISLRRTTSAPVSLPDAFLDPYLHAQGSSSTWDVDLQTVYNPELHRGRQSTFPSQPFTGKRKENESLDKQAASYNAEYEFLHCNPHPKERDTTTDKNGPRAPNQWQAIKKTVICIGSGEFTFTFCGRWKRREEEEGNAAAASLPTVAESDIRD
ncbi:hypothetical protein ACLOJK_001783 [Asimina triloba]